MSSIKKCFKNIEYDNYKKTKRRKEFFEKYHTIIGQCCINEKDCYDYGVDLQELKYECEKIHPFLDKESTDTICYTINEKLMKIKDKMTELKLGIINGNPEVVVPEVIVPEVIVPEVIVPEVVVPEVVVPINKSPINKKINPIPFKFKGGKRRKSKKHSRTKKRKYNCKKSITKSNPRINKK